MLDLCGKIWYKLYMKNELRALKLESSKSIRIDELDKAEYEKLKAFTGIPIIKLIHFAIPLLKKKYRYVDEESDKAVK